MEFKDLTLEELERIIASLGGAQMALRFSNSPIARKAPWRQKGGVIHFSVTSDGTTGREWISRLERGGFALGWYVDQVLLSEEFVPTSGVTTELVVLTKGLFQKGAPTTEQVRAGAQTRGFAPPNVEVACLIREKFYQGEMIDMGVDPLIVMHEPIPDHDGDPTLLGIRNVDSLIEAYHGSDDGAWHHPSPGFVFATLTTSTH